MIEINIDDIPDLPEEDLTVVFPQKRSIESWIAYTDSVVESNRWCLALTDAFDPLNVDVFIIKGDGITPGQEAPVTYSSTPTEEDTQEAGTQKQWTTTKGALTPEQVAEIARGVGFDYNNVVIGVAIAMAESGLKPTAYNGRPPDKSYGLWQINMIGKLGPDRVRKFKLSRYEDLFDPHTNARAAYIISGGGQDWSPWTTFTRGKYKQHLRRAKQAADKVFGRGR